MKRAKILFITSELVCGGAEKMITFLANSLSQNGYDIIMYSYEGSTTYFRLDDEIQFIPEEKIQTTYFTRRFIQAFQVRSRIRSINPDMVISFLTNQNVFSVIGTAFTKIPVIISERGDPTINRGIVAKIKYWFYNYADGVVFQTEGAKRFFCDNLQKKSIVIPNPVTYERSKRVPYHERKNNIAFVARFEIRQKRQDIMIEAFKKVLNNYKELKLIFYGDGSDMHIIEKMVEQYEMKDYVIFAGNVYGVQDYIADAKMFVLTSDYEGIPNSLIEAMSLGLPVIATDCSPGGARLLINNNENGILVSAGDVDKIAEAIIFLIENPDTAEKFGVEAQNIIERYSPQAIVACWVDYIERVIMK